MEESLKDLNKQKLTRLINGVAKANDVVDISQKIAAIIIRLLKEKNATYGDSYLKLRQEFPDYLPMRLTDKLNRLKVQVRNEADYTDTLVDLAGYCLLELSHLVMEVDNGNKNNTKSKLFSK